LIFYINYNTNNFFIIGFKSSFFVERINNIN
jgi:hypothetical protein